MGEEKANIGRPPTSEAEKKKDEKRYGLTTKKQLAYTIEYSDHKSEHIAKQNEQIAQHGIEPLTGLKRREVLVYILDKSLKKIREEGEHRKEGISLIFIDLDKFKQVNDTKGHSVGDSVLMKVAGLLEGAVRGTDIVARYGGDEFAVLLPDTSEKNAAVIAEKLRMALDNNVELKKFGVTASIGVCSSEVSTAADAKNFVKHADEAAYVAKRAGGNRVAIYT